MAHCAPGVTAEQPGEPHPAARPETVAAHGAQHIVGAGRRVATVGAKIAQDRREDQLVEPEQANREPVEGIE